MEAGPGKVFTDEELARLPREELVALVVSQASMIEMLMARVERLESEASRDSKTSSKPPSADNQARRAERAKAKAKAPGRKRGKRPGSQGHRSRTHASPSGHLCAFFPILVMVDARCRSLGYCGSQANPGH